MRSMKSYLIAVLSIFCISVAHAADLRASATVNITSDTAVAAKNIALSEARRQIINDVLGQYADVHALKSAVSGADDATLVTLIDGTEIDGEQTSDTMYAANITMSINDNAARQWLNEVGVQNWLIDGNNENRFVVTAELKNPVADWIALSSLARQENIDVVAKHIQGGNLTIEMPVSARGAFTIAVRENGWQYGDANGVLKIWKK